MKKNDTFSFYHADDTWVINIEAVFDDGIPFCAVEVHRESNPSDGFGANTAAQSVAEMISQLKTTVDRYLNGEWPS